MRTADLDIRREIETLAIWYIPVSAVLVITSVLMNGYFRDIASSGVSNLQTSSFSSFFLMAYAAKLVGFADNFAVAIWLFAQRKRNGGRKILWFLFGLAAHLFAVVIYLVLKLLEQQKKSSVLLETDNKILG